MKILRLFIFLAIALFVSARLGPASVASWRVSLFEPLAPILTWTRSIEGWFVDLRDFRRNARDAKALHELRSSDRSIPSQMEELRLENERLTNLLEIRRTLPPTIARSVAARVVARSPSVWNRVLFIDKGTMKGLHSNFAVLSGSSLIGKITESGPGTSKVALITDPMFRVGAIVQKTRDQGVLYGTPSGECRLKYLPLDTPIQEGDFVETAASSSNFPKAIPIGTIVKIWKEPGQVYRVALVKPFADLARIEEVLCVE